MEAKNVFKLILNLSDDQIDQIIIKAGKIGLSVSELSQIFADDIAGEEAPDDPERVALAEKWFEKLSEKCWEPTLLTYLLSLSDGVFRKTIDCLLFLKEKQEELDGIEDILMYLEDHSVKDADDSILAVLEQVCNGINVKNEDDVKACLKAEKKYIHSIMYSPDLGFDSNNFYSAPEILKERFFDYCLLYMKEDADINVEFKKVIEWMEKNGEQFQPLY